MMEDVYVYVVDLPHGIHEMIAPCEGGYTIYIDAKLSDERKIMAYNHAIDHILKGDFEKENVQEIEFDAHFRF